MSDITILLEQVKCKWEDCQDWHPNTQTYTAVLRLEGHETPIGDIKAYTFNRYEMECYGIGQMWRECQTFDEFHDDAKLDKVEDFLDEQDLPADRHGTVLDAEWVIYIDKICLKEEFRGRGYSLLAVRKLVEAFDLTTNTITMLQPGTVQDFESGDASGPGVNFARDLGILGFEAWSESDKSWLLCTSQVLEQQTKGSASRRLLRKYRSSQRWTSFRRVRDKVVQKMSRMMKHMRL